MKNKQKGFIVPVVIIAVVLVIGGSIYYFSQKPKSPQAEVNPSPTQTTITENKTTVTTETPAVKETVSNKIIAKDPKPEQKITLLQASPYINSTLGFSIYLPKNWVARAGPVASSIWAYDSSDTKETPDAMIVFGKEEITPEQNETLISLGADAFMNAVLDEYKSGYNQSKIVSSKKTTINNVLYYQFIITYRGEEINREATQYVYLTLTDKSYYAIGADAYTDTWLKISPAILQSITTLKLIK